MKLSASRVVIVLGMLLGMCRTPAITSAAVPEDAISADHDSLAVPTPVDTTRNRAARTKNLSFRARPYPETRWFFVLQTGVMHMPEHKDTPTRLVLDFGIMRNLGPRWALGVNYHGQSGSDGAERGFVLRGRRWLSRSISVDATAGLTLPDDNGENITWIGQAHLNLGNWVSLSAQLDRWSREVGPYGPTSARLVEPGPLSNRTSTGTSWLVGGTVGYTEGLVILGVAAVAAAIVSAIVISTADF